MSERSEREDTRQSVGQVLRGLELFPLPDGWTPIEALAVVKCLDASGTPTWCTRRTAGINDEELLGTMVLQSELLKRDILSDWEDDGDDD
ncbi:MULTISPECIES: hypothetical protein [unclassified Crossiella]|uniref:hypothetical protein n=1 Tax=unclassified Crossiella TaxID=2620835 RepID=UPI00207CD4B3|nr:MULTISPECIES: hypothetical protein [unclassified Crossiella]MCO1580893.1 hypothetical protein [Crossiella sp. SN42]WHT18162.1 hypothetical protein N8J89_34445 [Crossiella sp. CA-258035]